MGHLKEKILNRGVNDNDSPILKRKKVVFNVLNIVGSTTAIPQVILFFPYDILSSISHAIWGITALSAFILHKYIPFKKIRNISMFSILIFGNVASMRIGPELYPHIASLGLLFATFIFYDLKSERKFLAVFVTIQIICFYLTEFSVFQVTSVSIENLQLHRTFVLSATVLFLVTELFIFNDIIVRSETNVINDLRKSNAEKDILLKEVHHRVKNNLQLLSSLIRLRLNTDIDQSAVNQLEDINSRIRSIALLHNKVYLNESIQNINIEQFLNDFL